MQYQALGDYRIPQSFIQQRQPQSAEAPVEPSSVYGDAEDPNHPLAVRGKLTADYYDNYGMLDSYAKKMAKDYGIDVFAPDFTQPGGGEPFQLAQKLQANIMYAANALKNEFEAEKQIRPFEMRGEARLRSDVPREGLYYSDAGENFISTKALPGVEEANNRGREDTFDPQSSQRINAVIQQESKRIDDLVKQGLLKPEEGELQKSYLVNNAYKTSAAQMTASAKGYGKTQDFLNRAELIKQVKAGIINNDQTPLNLLKRVSGVKNAKYVNTGDKVGLEVSVKGQDEPTFIDFRTQDAGAGEINALLNNIEGQLNIPNEKVFQFDTNVNIPPSNAKDILETAKAVIKNIPRGEYQTIDKDKFKSVMDDLMALSRKGELITPDGDLIASIEPEKGGWFSGDKPTRLKINYYITEKGKPTSKIKSVSKVVDDNQDYLERLVDVNDTQITEHFGAGFSNATNNPNNTLTDRQTKALQAFVSKFNRQPNDTELQKLLEKYK